MEKNDYVSLHREASVGIIDSRASSTPTSDIEKEMVYLQGGLKALSRWQSCLYGNTSNREGLLKEVPALRDTANRYARKIMGLGQHHLISHLFISRVQELSGYGLPMDVAEKIQPGAMFWTFSSNPAFGRNYYLLHDFRGMKRQLASKKRGGDAVTSLRAICAGLLFCLAGFRGDDDLVPDGLDDLWGLKIVYAGHKGQIKGLHQYLSVVLCGVNKGIFETKPDCGKQFVKLDSGWQETY